MSFPRTDADLLARIAVLEFVLDQVLDRKELKIVSPVK